MYYTKPINWNREVLAYMVGIALGDGNLSLMNGRSVRLRVSCDLKYPFLITEILGAICSPFKKRPRIPIFNTTS